MCVSENIPSAVLRVSPGGRNSVYGRVFIVGGLAAAKFVVIESVLLFEKGGWDDCLSLIPCEELGEKENSFI